MKFFALAAIAATLIAESSAQTLVYGVKVNGTDYGAGAGRYIRQAFTTDPVKNLTSTDIRCNTNGYKPVSDYVQVPAGGVVNTEWYQNTPGDGAANSTTSGPLIAYLSFAGPNGVGDVWDKIYEDGYSGGWAVENLRKNGGNWGIPIPQNLIPGLYILRAEYIALDEADVPYSQNPARGAKFYMTCIQIQITGEGSEPLPQPGVSFPDIYSENTPGIVWNLTADPATSYPIPGPKVVSL